MRSTRHLAHRILGLFVFLAAFGLCGASFAANLEQRGFVSLSGYTQLSNFDMDQDGALYVIKDSKTNASLVRIGAEGNQTGSFAAAANAKDLTVAPSGGAAFYRTSGEPNRIWRVDLTNNTQSSKSGFTSGGSPITVETIEAVSDTEVLISWVSEYDENAAYPNWLPGTVKVGKFSFSGSTEPTQVWTWSPQWQSGEVNFDGDPAAKRLGNSWGYYLSHNPETQRIGIYTVHMEKFTQLETERNHYAAVVTHLYMDDGTVFSEIPSSSFTSGGGAFLEPYFTSTGVLMYRENSSYQGRAGFPVRIYLADQDTYALRSGEYVESWQDDAGQTVSLSGLWSNPPEAHVQIVIHTFIDDQRRMALVCGTRDIETGEAISTQLVMFGGSGQTSDDPAPDTNPATPADPDDPEPPSPPLPEGDQTDPTDPAAPTKPADPDDPEAPSSPQTGESGSDSSGCSTGVMYFALFSLALLRAKRSRIKK